MGEPYGFWNPPEGPDGYPGDGIINEANEARDLRRVLGFVVDAAMDTIEPYDMLAEVASALREACALLGGTFLPYLDRYPLALDGGTHRSPASTPEPPLSGSSGQPSYSGG